MAECGPGYCPARLRWSEQARAVVRKLRACRPPWASATLAGHSSGKMLQTLLALILVFSSMTAARAIGMRVAGRWMETLHTGLKFSLAAALGLLIISYSVFFLVVFGWASQVAFWILSGIVVLILIVDPTCRGASLRSVTFWIASLTRRERLSLAGAVAYCLGILALVELPVTSVDELIYHLEIPHRLLESQGRYSFQDNIYAYFPQLGEMLFLFGYAVSGVSAARLFNAVFGLLLAVALYGFSRRSLSRADSFFAVAALFSAPSVLVVASLAYVDLVFTLYGFLALVLLLRFVQKRRLIWAVLAGVMGGGAWCTKYTGMQLLLLLVLIGLVGHLINKRKEFPWQLGMTIAVSLMVVTPYLLRNWIQTGWPLFPFDLGVFDLDPAINWDKEAPIRISLTAYCGTMTMVIYIIARRTIAA